MTHAEGDLHYARLGVRETGTLPNLIACHAQQAVEKGLKAVLVARQAEFPRTHDLEVPPGLVKEAGLDWPPELDEAKEFTPFAVQSRYPGFDDPITLTEVEEAIAPAEKVVAWVRGIIKDSNA